MKRSIIIFILISFLLIQWSDDPNRSSPVFTNTYVHYWLMDAVYSSNNLIVLSEANGSVFWLQALDSNGNRLWGENGKKVPLFLGDYNAGGGMISDGFDGLIFYTYSFYNLYRKTACFVQCMDKDGNFLWGSEGVKVIEHNYFWAYSVRADGTGGAYLGLLCWDGPKKAFHLQRIGADGNRLWGNTGIKVNISDLSFKRYIRLVTVNNGEAVIAVWAEFLKGRLEIYAQKYDRNGNPQWSAPGILVYSGQHTEPHTLGAASDGADGVVISWSDKRDIGYATHHIFAQHIDGEGNMLWNEEGAYVGSATKSGRFQRSYLLYSWLKDSNGGYIFAWLDERGLVMQRIGSDGKRTWDMNGIIVDPRVKSRYQSYPILTNMSHGKFLLVWDLGWGGNLILANLYDLNGNSIWNDKLTLVDTNLSYELSWILPVYDGNNGAVLLFDYWFYAGIWSWSGRENIRAFHINEDGTVGFPFLKVDDEFKVEKIAGKKNEFQTEN